MKKPQYTDQQIAQALRQAVAAASVRVWQITSWGRGPRGGHPLPEGASVDYPLDSPAYDVGLTEPEVRDRWERYFQSLRDRTVQSQAVPVKIGTLAAGQEEQHTEARCQ